MSKKLTSEFACDPAAIYCITHSIVTEAKEIDDQHGFEFSDAYNGWDNVMRQANKVANIFESWACRYVDFDRYEGVWPYEMEVNFGEHLFELISDDKILQGYGDLESFRETDCAIVALAMGLPMLKKAKEVSNNSIFTIFPYNNCGIWMFDDESVDLKSEAFVSGADTFIDLMLERKGIKNGDKGFVLQFSATEFPEYDAMLTWVSGNISNEGNGGNFGNDYIHESTGHMLWLCPALFCYFDKAPAQLFVKVSQKTKTKKKGQ